MGQVLKFIEVSTAACTLLSILLLVLVLVLVLSLGVELVETEVKNCCSRLFIDVLFI